MERAQIEWLASMLEGTADGIENVVERYDMELPQEVDEIEDALLDFVERCPHCDWWFEPGELSDGAGDVIACPDCRKDT